MDRQVDKKTETYSRKTHTKFVHNFPWLLGIKSNLYQLCSDFFFHFLYDEDVLLLPCVQNNKMYFSKLTRKQNSGDIPRFLFLP